MLYPMMSRTYKCTLLCIGWDCFVVADDSVRGCVSLGFMPQTWYMWA